MPISLRQPGQPPLLLVSVRHAGEAVDAIAGGCQILDVKDPARGSLGFAGAEAIASVLLEGIDAQLPVTAALGELLDWDNGGHPLLPLGLSYVKLGPAGMGSNTSWQAHWTRVLSDVCRGTPAIAVAYADWDRAKAPPAESVISAALESDCVGALIDTWDKSGACLLELVEPTTLAAWSAALHAAGRFLAIAGRLHTDDLEPLREIGPDVIAVRSAACRDRRRHEPIDVQAVRCLRRSISSVEW